MPIEDAAKLAAYWVFFMKDAPDAESLLSCTHRINGFEVTWTRATAGGNITHLTIRYNDQTLVDEEQTPPLPAAAIGGLIASSVMQALNG